MRSASCRYPWTRAHRDAEAAPARLSALDGDAQDPPAPGRVSRVDRRPAHEDAVLDGDPRELAGPHPEEGKRRPV